MLLYLVTPYTILLQFITVYTKLDYYPKLDHLITNSMMHLDLPVDVQAYVLELQAKIKIEKQTGQYSQPQTIIHIIREHKKLSDQVQSLQQQLTELLAEKKPKQPS